MSYVHVKSEKKIEFPRGIGRCFLPNIVKAFLFQQGDFFVFYVLYQHCFISRPSDSIVSEDAEIGSQTLYNPQSKAVFSVVRIGAPPPPHTQASVLPPLWFRGGDHTRLWESGVGGGGVPIPTSRQKL